MLGELDAVLLNQEDGGEWATACLPFLRRLLAISSALVFRPAAASATFNVARSFCLQVGCHAVIALRLAFSPCIALTALAN
jgi:hypothetical protein